MPVIYPQNRAEQSEYAALLHSAGVKFRYDTGAVPVFGFRIGDHDAVPAGIPADRVSGAVIRFAPDPDATPAPTTPRKSTPPAAAPPPDKPAADDEGDDTPTPADDEPDTTPSPSPSRKRRKGR